MDVNKQSCDSNNITNSHYQTITLILTDGRKVHYTGLVQIEDSNIKVVDILISKPIPLPANTYFSSLQ